MLAAGEPPGRGRLHPVLRLVLAAEEVGFDAVVLDARPTGAGAVRDPFVLLGAAAELTSVVALGALTAARRRPPGIVGKAVATLDVCSSGRALHVLGPAPDGAADELREELEVISTLLRRPSPSYDGTYHRLVEAWNEPRAGRPTPTPLGLLVPADGPPADGPAVAALLATAAEAADWCVLEVPRNEPDLGEQLAIVAGALAAAAAGAGRPAGAVHLVPLLRAEEAPGALAAALAAADGAFVSAASLAEVRRLGELARSH